MITGVETAGLVLAILPLIISTLEHYNDGMKPLKDFLRYKQVVRELVVDLSTQRALFRNTLEKLLSGCVHSDSKLAILLERPGGQEWQDEKLASDLKHRLQGCYHVYMDSVNHMEILVKSLQDKMGLDDHGRPGWIDSRGHKKAWRKFSMCLSRKEHEKILDRMDKDNRNLKNLTKDSLDLEPIRTSRRKCGEPFKKIRDYAQLLHKVLKQGWSCTCKLPHNANLRLEIRDSESTPSFRVLFSSGSTSPMPSPSPAWRETDIRPSERNDQRVIAPRGNLVDSQSIAGATPLTVAHPKTHMAIMSSSLQLDLGVPFADHTNSSVTRQTKSHQYKKQVSWAASIEDGYGQSVIDNGVLPKDPHQAFTSKACQALAAPERTQIANLCHKLAEVQHMEQHEECLGCLVDEERSLNVYARRPSLISSWTSTTTLHEILTDATSTDKQASRHMTKKQRLQVAVILASTMLQLQNTEWLGSKWGKEDILFHNGLAEHPYISKLFHRDVTEDQKSTRHPLDAISPIRNEGLFNLGVLLLELSYGKALDHFKNAEDPPIFTEFAIARRLVEELTEEEASGYADAARACIFCDFGTKCKVSSLENEAFRQAVYDDVVVPLEDEWKHWNKIPT